MPGYHHLNAHLSGALNHGVKIIDLEPQQHSVSIRPVVTVADPAVLVLHFEAVQLKHKLTVRYQPFIVRAPVIAPQAQQTLIPSAACFHIGYGDERLGTHPIQRNNSGLAHIVVEGGCALSHNRFFVKHDRIFC